MPNASDRRAARVKTGDLGRVHTIRMLKKAR
jgi:hypothetical protein